VITATLFAPIALRVLSDRPLVSVLISNYNYEKYINQAIESVLSQTYQNFELIICDDGSTDRSKQIISEYCRRDDRVHLIAKENGGQASGFNAAYTRSKGELVCFLDSDDLFRLNKLECMVEAYQHAPNAGFGVHRVQRVNKRRKSQGVWPLGSRLPQGWHAERMLKDGGALGYMPPTSGLSLHRSVAERIFPLPEHFRVCADQVIIRLAPLLTEITRRQEVLAEYRLHDANSYERSRMTAESIQREVIMCQDLWIVQHKFLESIDSTVASKLVPSGHSSYVLYLKYLHARLSRSSSTRVHHHNYIRDKQNNSDARMLWVWKNSIYLPAFLFERMINLMNRQNMLKDILAKLRGIT